MSSNSKSELSLSTQEKRALLARLLKKKKKVFPASFAQQRLWFLDQLEPNSSSYNIVTAVRASGRLSLTVLQQSVDEIIRRHETLRTTFALVNESPQQVIHAELPPELRIIDLSDWPEGEQENEVQRLLREEAGRPFNLAQGPLLRIGVLRLDEQDHIVALAMHHIISDAWSMTVLVQEFTSLYRAFSEGAPSPLPPLAIQYVDFAQWQRKWLSDGVLERQLEYWKQQLAAILVLQLQTDRPRLASHSHQRGAHPFTLSKSLATSIEALGRQENATLFMTLLAAFNTLLHRYTAQDDVVVGTPIAGRNRKETEALIGFFVNTLVLRTDLGGDPTFRELLARVRETSLQAYAHQDLPFEMLVEKLHPERSLSQTPLFQVMFVLQNTTAFEVDLPQVSIRSVSVESTTAKFDLTLAMQQKAEGLRGCFEYSTNLYDAATIERMAGHFQSLLEGIVLDPDKRLSELPILTEVERRQLLSETSVQAQDYAVEECLHELFEEQVERTPNAIAVSYEAEQLTYNELNRRANQLARYLRKLGVGPEMLVGICVERSIEMVVGLLGILKSGAAYVPFDSSYPLERLSFMLEDAAPGVLLTQERLLHILPAHWGHTICLDSEWDLIDEEDADNLLGIGTDENLAYVIYTSGSTGQPKGAMLNHRGVVNCLRWMQDTYKLDETDRFLLKTSLNFDPSVWELFWTLWVGGCVVVARPEGHLDSAYLLETIGKEQVTTVYFVPSMLRVFVEAAGVAKATSLRRVICGGEGLPKETMERFFERLGGAELHHSYGPTETSIAASEWLCVPGANKGMAPIGRPPANTRIYLLDDYLRPVPVGAAGELYIGGVHVGRGYLNRFKLTAEKFVPDPFSREPGARFYRTGDLARYLPDGNIEFLGRVDSQVKIRGYRIELGEIQSVLSQHPPVRDVAVIAREDAAGEKRLVAYLVVEDETDSAASELRRLLQKRLPDYMIPASFVFLDQLPLTANGKLDRHALPVPEFIRSQAEVPFVSPRDSIEIRLLHIWEDILDIRPISILDNFFQIGGHSLLAFRLMARIEESFGEKLALATLFERPTIEQLASLLRRQQKPIQHSSLIAIRCNGSRLPFFCVHPAGGNILCYLELARHMDAEQPFYAFQAQGLDEERAPYSDVETMATRYVEELLDIQPNGPYLIGGYSMGGVVAFEMAQQLRARGKTVGLLALFDSKAPPTNQESEVGSRERLMINFGLELGLAVEQLDLSSDSLSSLEPEQQVRYVLEEAKRRRLLPADIGEQQILRTWRVFETNAAAMRNYVPRIYPGEIALFKAMDHSSNGSQDYGWKAFAGSGVDAQQIPGDHFSLMREPHVRSLAQRLSDCLSKIAVTDSMHRRDPA
jgi:amino acid adenylation domain-containing protein